MKLDKIANSGNDEFYTPPYAVEPILKYIKPDATVWCPFDTADSWFVKLIANRGGQVFHSHISEGQDFFNMEVPDCDYIISNPPYSCLTPDHDVLTKDGWKPIYEIKESDYVLTTDYNKNISWQQNNHLIVKEVEETTYEFSSKYLDLQVTQEHRMFAYNGSGKLCINKNTKDLAVAKEVCQSWYQPRIGWNWEGENEPFFTLPETFVSNGHTEIYKPQINIPILDWVKFFGLWIADGCTRQTRNIYNKPRYTISIKQHEKTADKAFEIVSALPFNVKVYNSGNKKNIEIHSKQLWEYLSIFGKSKDKFVPNFIKNGSKEVLQAFMEGYSFGDSYKMYYKNNETTVLSTVSKRLSEDLQEILLKLGRIVPVITQKYNGKEIYSLTISKDTTFSNKMKYGKPNLSHYKGKVYCLQLQNNSVFLVRRNGKICFTGNCKTEVLNHLFEIGKPFAMLLGVVGLFESQKRFNMFKNNEFEIMYMNKRVAYFQDYKEQKPSLNPPFSSVYVCHKMLPKQIVFEVIDK